MDDRMITANECIDPTTDMARDIAAAARAIVAGWAAGDVTGAMEVLCQVDNFDPVQGTNLILALAGIPIAMAEWLASHTGDDPLEVLARLLRLLDETGHTWKAPTFIEPAGG